MQLVKIFYHLVIACWLGGAVLFTFVLTPIIFKAYSRDIAGGIVGVLFPGYFRWGLTCGITALICLFLVKDSRVVISGVILTAMLAITAAQAFIIEPKAAELKKEIPSFETTPPDHPRRIQFRKIHGISAIANLAVIGAGVILVILSSLPAQKN
jgi:hypothetical protein